MAVADALQAALRMTREWQPDVAFRDVRVRGETAFDGVRRLREERPPIVFATAWDTCAVRGAHSGIRHGKATLFIDGGSVVLNDSESEVAGT